MRIQQRTRVVRAGIADAWDPWTDWPVGKELICYNTRNLDVRIETQVRIVDDEGNEVPQTAPFVPGFYEYVGPTTAISRPDIRWFTYKPSASEWLRRDDVKPTARP